MSSPPPNATVYVRNLEERIKVDQLKEALTELFSEYGEIIDIVAKTNLKAKGQAFIVFDSVESAQKAIDEVQGFELFDKPMQLAFAKTRSDASVKRTGDEHEFETHKKRRLAEKDKKLAAEQAEEQKRLKRAAPPGAVADVARPIKATRGAGLKSTNAGAAAVIPDEYLPPNKILFVQNLPEEYDIDALTAIFGRFEGFREVRLVPGRRGIAFIEYESEAGAITAKENTAGMALGAESQIMKVTYQRQ
ncbi:RNA recognition domain-containing protein [Mollisia scopiformis]|uniref:RNA recognition domain-containing protein n=1 Tax=Mollisia scopiformis TaxID=149040 RepID=A0A132B4R7_MOLSC|nr:RNA recognition domain-containing protein [Mollisia scopiformis]KUJ06904.1 RNA recognition domain-containing protein [Mollisia scopiformis]